MLRLSSVNKGFTQGQRKIEVLNNINFAVNNGETVAIVGSSGSGKTTLLSLLAGLDRADDGQVVVAGKNLTVMSENELSQFRRQYLGIVFQQYHLMPHLTALENVSLPLEISGLSVLQSNLLAEQALTDVGLQDRCTHFQEQLSGGECQRVAIARALVSKPKLLLADEPSGNLDEVTGKTVMDLLFQLVEAQQTTMVLVTHDSELADRCHRKVTLTHGKFAE